MSELQQLVETTSELLPAALAALEAHRRARPGRFQRGAEEAVTEACSLVARQSHWHSHTAAHRITRLKLLLPVIARWAERAP